MAEQVFFTSDTHFAHKNIKRFCPNTRLGKDINDHDEILIREWNKVIRPEDRVYHLGDFCFGNNAYAEKVLSRLMGQIHFLYGNHDNVIMGSAKLRERFTWIGHYKEIDLPAPNNRNVLGHPANEWVCAPGQDIKPKMQKVVMFHFPIFEWNRMHHGSFHLYGHVHGDVQIPGRALDVGVDTRPQDKLMTPWTWEEVYTLLIKKEIRGHHEVKKGL